MGRDANLSCFEPLCFEPACFEPRVLRTPVRRTPVIPPGPALAAPPAMTMARQRLGERGENLACRELTARGYHILHRRYRTRHGELDVVAEQHGVLVFVEVRARGSGRFGHPADSVDPQKQQRVAAMAESYLGLESQHGRVCRFDVVAVETEGDPPRITLYPDAFRPGW